MKCIMKFVHLEMHHVDMKGKRIEEAREMVEVRNTKYFHNGSFVGGGGGGARGSLGGLQLEDESSI
jgi:hypothetical protein